MDAKDQKIAELEARLAKLEAQLAPAMAATPERIPTSALTTDQKLVGVTAELRQRFPDMPITMHQGERVFVLPLSMHELNWGCTLEEREAREHEQRVAEYVEGQKREQRDLRTAMSNMTVPFEPVAER